MNQPWRAPCPDENVVAAFARGELAPAVASEVEVHMDACPSCAGLLAELVRIFPTPISSRVTPPSLGETLASRPSRTDSDEGWMLPGERVSRYRVLEAVGAGGMGVVYAAYDPELDRRVALKLLREGGPGTTGGDARPRLQREAQALARLSHPNVVAVHDVGTHGDRLFLAMEFVDGQTLARWCQDRSRSWPELREVFLAAGRGLAAAHAAGIVHRDFKPDNVLIDGNGRVRVTDFGLAQIAGAASQPEPDPSSPPTDAGPLTQTGAIVGTPAYMAPEQFESNRGDAAADQYSFCVALHEAIYGARPFTAKSFPELAFAIQSGPPPEPPRDPRVPARVRAAILRGLSREPSARFADMGALLTVLDHRPARGWLTAAAVALPIVVVAWVARAWFDDGRERPAICKGDAFDEVWGVARRDRVLAILGDGRMPFGDVVSRTFGATVDAYRDRWLELRGRACDPTSDEDASAGVVALRMLCLEDRRADLAGIVHALEDAAEREHGTEVLAHAPKMAEGLPSLDACDDVARMAVLRGEPVPPAIASEVVERRAALAEAKAMLIGGAYDRALELADAVADPIEALAWDPLRAEQRLARGRALVQLGRNDEARAAYEAAGDLATRAGDRRVAATVLVELLYVYGQSGNEIAQGELVSRLARSEIGGLGDPADLLARWHKNRATLLWQGGDADAAIAELETALAVAGTEDTPLFRIELLFDVSALEVSALRFEAAAEHLARCRELMHEHLGPMHPSVAGVEYAQGLLHVTRMEWAQAQTQFEKSLAIRAATLGERHPDYASDLATLGDVLGYRGRHAEATAKLEQALAIYVDAYGERHIMSLNVRMRLAQAYLGAGRAEDARREAQQAIDGARASLAAAHPFTAAGLGVLGGALSDLGRTDEAVAVLRDALATAIAAHGEKHSYVAAAHGELGRALREAGDLREAEAELTRAIAMSEGDVLAVDERGWLQYQLARARWEQGKARGKAREVVQAAIEDMRAHGAEARAEQAAAWLAALP